MLETIFTILKSVECASFAQKDEDDESNVIMEIRAGTGGDELVYSRKSLPHV